MHQLWHSMNSNSNSNNDKSANITQSQSHIFSLLNHNHIIQNQTKDPLIEDDREIYNPSQRNRYLKPNTILIENEKLEPNSKDEIFLPSQYSLSDININSSEHDFAHEATIVLAMILDETADNINQPLLHQR